MKKGWELKTLGEVCDFVRGLTYSKKDEVDFSSNVVLRSTNIDLTTNKLNLTELKYIKDDIVIPENKKVSKGSLFICTANGSKSHLGKVALIDDDYDYAFGGFMGLIKPCADIAPKFLYYLMISENYKKFISELSDGANINNLKFRDLSEFQVVVPPIDEQQRIVAILDEAFAAIDQAKENVQRNLQNTKELFQSELNSMFANKGDGWEEKTVQEISKIISGYSFKSGDFSETNKVKSVKITNVGVKEFIEEDGNYLPGDFSSAYSNFSVSEGNIVIALTRTIISSGLKVAVVPESYHGALLNQRVAALIPHEHKVNHRFLYNFLCTELVANYVRAHVNTLMQPNLSINDLKKLPVPCPNLSVQNLIINKLDNLSSETERLQQLYIQKLNSLEELKKSLLQKAFSGELSAAKELEYDLEQTI